MSYRFGPFIQFDASKIDKAALRQWLVSGVKLLEPAIITPGNIDQFLFEQLDGLLQRIIDGISKQDGTMIVGSDGAMLFAGELPVSMQEVSQFLSRYPGMPEACREMLRENPRIIRRLAKFSEADQQLIVSNPLLLIALQTLLPLLFQLLMNRFKD
jgi:hypothetical protein